MRALEIDAKGPVSRFLGGGWFCASGRKIVKSRAVDGGFKLRSFA